ncbi:TPA: DNA-protecting protein DprA [Candidatus Avigastranaerophilus faecigallinarum]|nr:DNA-protecting protein DprA [Candidatus Avigastranaerophilus faecigallinarum]
MENEYIYWLAIAHLPRWTQEKINQLVVEIIHNKKIALSDFFNINSSSIQKDFKLSEKELKDIQDVKNSLPNLSFLVEKLLNEGYRIIPLNSELYPKIMKENLKIKYSPTVIYTKGDVKILQENAVAIVGARDANAEALEFTDNIAKKMANEYKVVVSGFAKGVDKQALNSSIKYNGNSIIVLPQGILTFDSGFRKYYKEINTGGVIVLSTFPPEAGWSTGLAMARNRYIYGLAKEIYVAQTNEKGGTWQGATEGLKNKREVFVYYPKKDEKCANYQLIKLGAKAVDFNGNILNIEIPKEVEQLKIF